MVLDVKRAEPGTKVNIKIDYDIDKTLENIKKFVESYNKVNEFIDKQFQVDRIQIKQVFYLKIIV